MAGSTHIFLMIQSTIQDTWVTCMIFGSSLLIVLVASIPGAIGSGRFTEWMKQSCEGGIDVQSERTKGKNHQAYLWQYSRPGGAVLFDFQLGREREGPKRFLGDFEGILQ